jgi:hypothetical protein
VNLNAELAEALKTNASEDASIVVRTGNPMRLHFEFSAKVALGLALNRHDNDQSKHRAQVEATIEGTGAFVRFVDALVDAYFEARNLGV